MLAPLEVKDEILALEVELVDPTVTLLALPEVPLDKPRVLVLKDQG
jgi:hypothetical protein